MPTPVRLHPRRSQLRAVPAALALTGLLVGVPWLLITVAGAPWTPLLSGWDRPLDDATLISVLALFGWILWAVFARDVVAETLLALADAADRRHGRATPPHRIRPGGPVRVVAAVLVGAIAGAVLVDLARGITSTRTGTAFAAPPPTAAVATIRPSTVDVHAEPASTGPRLAAARQRQQPPAWAANAPGGAYLVVESDNEWDIAAKQLGDPYRWREIYVLSRHHPQPDGRTLTDPALIHPGWWLALPARTPPATDPTPAPPASTPDNADSQPPTAGQPTLPIAPVPTATAPTGTATAPAPTPAVTPDPATPTGPAPAASASASPDQHGDADRDQAVGVVLPSQAWISAGLAALIASVAVLVRLHRRRQARHTFPIPVTLSPEADPVPPGLRLADEVGRRQLRARPDPAPVPTAPTVAAAIGTTVVGEEVSLFDLPGGGVALDGDGAAAVVRAVLAAVVSTGVLESVAHRPVVLATTDTLRRLLPASSPVDGLDPGRVSFDPERLIVATDTAAAVTALEEEVIHRRRLLDSLDVDSVDEANALPDHAEYQPVRVLLLQSSPRHEARLAAIAAHADTLRLRLVIIGPTGAVPTLTVDATGAVTTTSPEAPSDVERLSTLAASDLAGVLDLVRATTPRPVNGFDIDDPAVADLPAAGEMASVDVPGRPDNPVPVWLRVLGPTTLTVNGTPLASGIRSGSRAMLTLLAVHPKGRTLDEIVADLHPTVEATQAISRVKTDITSLRTVLRAAAGPTFERAWFVLYDAATSRYRIEQDTIDVDLWKMIRTVEAANSLGEDDTRCLAALRQAVDCYGGDFAVDDTGTWSIGYATTFRHQYLSALTRIAELLEPETPDEAAAVLEQAITVDATNEELYQRLMRIHGRHHRPDEVRRLLGLLSERLMQAGEAEPSEATRRVAMRQLHQHSPR